MKKSVCVAASLLLAGSLAAGAWGAEKPIEVKALVLAMFEVGENSGDFAGEFQHWYEGYLADAPSYQVGGVPQPLFVNADGVAGILAGMGKANAAATLTALLSDRRFDWDKTYILVSGCGGGSPKRVTLGDVVWATHLVDYELGNGWLESDNEPGKGPADTFRKGESYAPDGFITLNQGLARWAYDLTKNTKLADGDDAAAYRALYDGQKGRKPAVSMGTSVTGDSYWHGAASSARADGVCAAYGAPRYLVTQMEDNGFGVVARRFGKLDRLLVLRDVVNFDQPHQGQTVLQSLDASSGGFSIGMTNGFAVGKKVVDALVADWAVYGSKTPAKD